MMKPIHSLCINKTKEALFATLSLSYPLIRNVHHLNIHEGQVKTIFVHWRPVTSHWKGIIKRNQFPLLSKLCEPCNQQILPEQPSGGKEKRISF